MTAYIDKNNCPIRIDDRIAADIEKNARHVLAMAKRGAKVIFPDVFKIYCGLEQQLQQNTIVSLIDQTGNSTAKQQRSSHESSDCH